MTRRTLDLPKTPARAGKRKSSAPRPVRISYVDRSPVPPTPAAPPAAAAVPRPPRHENADDPRLSKRMGELGLCSRREADEWITRGWVKVDGKVVDTLGVRVSPQARIEVDPAATAQQSGLVTILLHKPVGFVSGQAEDGYEPAVVLIRPENRWAEDPSPLQFQPAHLRGLAPAGRLDIDSTGLLVFTQDGRVAKHLIGQDSSVEKEYLVRVEGTLADDGMRRLRHGLMLDGVRLKPAQVAWQNDDQLRFLLREGRKRQIRRMCELVGLVVTGLKRVRSGNVPLGRLPVGQWRYLRRDEAF
jgi:23S rRNA pseudouridine2604 synthase